MKCILKVLKEISVSYNLPEVKEASDEIQQLRSKVNGLTKGFDELLVEYRKEVQLYSGQDTEFTVKMHNVRAKNGH